MQLPFGAFVTRANDRITVSDNGTVIPFETIVDIAPEDMNPFPNTDVYVATLGDDGCPADLAPPQGELDFFDVLAYLSLFAAQDPAADLAEPIGSFDFFDILGYLALFEQGC